MRLFLLFLLVANCAHSAPFLVSDPWPLTDAQGNVLIQPDGCTATEGTASKPLTLITTAGAKSIRHDMAGTTSGAHKWTVTCINNAWGVASDPVNFPFAAGAPGAPAGLHLAP